MTSRQIPEPTIPPGFLYSWESQARQFPKVGRPGVEYRVYCACGAPACAKGQKACGAIPVDTFTYRNRKGHLVGILYHYPTTAGLEKAGNVNVWVRPDRQRRGIGTRLLQEAMLRLGPFNVEQQRYTPAGAAWVARLHEKGQEIR